MMFLISRRLRSLMPISSRGMGFEAARIRMTMSSLEFTVGKVATRNSMVRSRMRNLILPSWGLRFSEMSKRAMILNRATSGLRKIAGISW